MLGQRIVLRSQTVRPIIFVLVVFVCIMVAQVVELLVVKKQVPGRAVRLGRMRSRIVIEVWHLVDI